MIAYDDSGIQLHHGDCLDVLRSLPDASVDAVVTDPPYGLEFMGKAWDKFTDPVAKFRVGTDADEGFRVTRGSLPDAYRAGAPFQQWCQQWATECLRVLKPGGHMLAFGGTRTWHRLACAVEDAGFEIRDSIAYLYGSGFPKSLNASRALDASRCRCEMGESDHAEPAPEHDVRALRDGDVSPAEGAPRGARSVLLEGLPQQGSPTAGRAQLRPTSDGSREPRLEGRCDAQTAEGQLLGGQVRPLSPGVPGDVAGGRLHHGASSGDGSVAGALPSAVGGCQPQGPQPVEQRPGESGAVPVERGSQAWGGWPVCERCAQPVIPDGLGTALKPGHEPIVVARKPLTGTVAANVLTHGTGALNIDACRIGDGERIQVAAGTTPGAAIGALSHGRGDRYEEGDGRVYREGGRWPANVTLDDNQAAALDQQSGERPGMATQRDITRRDSGTEGWGNIGKLDPGIREGFNDTGGASRFFYTAKADSSERVKVDGIAHPTVKPLTLMRWLVRLVTPPGGTVLEPFAGSGTTVEACILEGFRCVAIEREADYLPLIRQRINRRRDPVEAVRAAGEDGGLFDLLDGGAA